MQRMQWTDGPAVGYQFRMMLRTHLMLTEPQMRWLQREAARLGVSVSEVLRRILDEKREAK